MFRRRPVELARPPSPPDPHLPLLSVAAAAWLADLLQRSLADLGLTTRYDGAGSLFDADDNRYGLADLSVIASQARRQDWPRLVAEHARVIASMQTVAAPVSLDEARDLLLLSLAAVDQVSPDWSAEGAEVLPGVVALATLDHPTRASQAISAKALAQLGGWSAVEPVARANVRRLPPPTHHSTQPGPRPDSTVHVFFSEDCYGASRFLALEELLMSMLLVERPAHGVLLAVPNRHVLVVHVVTGAGLVAAMPALAQLTAKQYASGPGPLSPEVFYRAVDGRTQRVSSGSGDADGAVEVTGLFEEAWRACGLSGDA